MILYYLMLMIHLWTMRRMILWILTLRRLKVDEEEKGDGVSSKSGESVARVYLTLITQHLTGASGNFRDFYENAVLKK